MSCAPTTNLCDSGIATAVQDTGAGSWIWSCVQSNGTNAACYTLQSTTPSPTPTPPVTGGFTVSTSGFTAPNNSSWNMRGLDATVPDALQGFQGVQTDFPGLTAIRLNCVPGSDSDSSISQVVQEYNAANIVVEVEDHSGNGDNIAWYQDMATTYKNSPLVFLETPNEPSADAATTAQNQIGIINAIRAAGFTNPIGVQPNGGYDFANVGTVVSALGTTQLFVTPHIYDSSTNPNDPAGYVQADLQAAQGLGLYPSIDEFGNAMDGYTLDPYGNNVITSVIAANESGQAGALFWAMDNGNHPDGADSAYLTPDGSQLTSTGQTYIQPWLSQTVAAIGGGTTPTPTPSSCPAPTASPASTPAPTPSPTPAPTPSPSANGITQSSSPDCFTDPASPQSPISPITGAISTSITDGSGNKWTLSNVATALMNGQAASYSQDVVRLVVVNGTVYQQNIDGLWWSWNGTGWSNAASVPSVTATIPTVTSGLTAPTAFSTTNASGQTVMLQCGQLYVNGVATGTPLTVSTLTPTPSPTPTPTPIPTPSPTTTPAPAAAGCGTSQGKTLSALPTTGLCSSSTASTVTDTGAGSWIWSCLQSDGTNAACYALKGAGNSCIPSTGNATGQFHVANGQIIDPNGNVFIARGINVNDFAISSVSTDATGAPLTTLFSGINFVRVAVYSYNDPSYYQAFVNQLTTLGIVVSFGDYTNSTGTDSGGGAGVVYTGAALNDELNWYTSMATAFANNPYVWFSTNNEPPNNPSLAALSTWHQQSYQAIRNAGNNSIILIDEYGGGVSGDMGVNSGLTVSDYASMTNVGWDIHQYGWQSNYSTDQATVSGALSSMATEAQTITSADGTIPVVIGEYGNATTTTVDANAKQVITAVDSSGYGSAAWTWFNGGIAGNELTDGNNNLTSYGQQVEQYIGTGATGAPDPGAAVATPGTTSSGSPSGSGTCTTPTPTPMPAPTPSGTPTPTPAPSPAPTPTPAPSPAPTPAPSPTPTPAACGTSSGKTLTSAPSSNLCSSGTATTVADTGAQSWSWICTQSDGTNAACYALQSTSTTSSCPATPTGNSASFDPNNPTASGMQLTFDDEFNQLSAAEPGQSATWETNFYYNSPQPCNYDASPFSVTNGVLNMNVSATSAAMAACGITAPYTQYPIGHLDTYGSFSQQYGYFETRAQVSNVYGTIFAFWMIPENGSWPPEIDAPEILGRSPTTDYVTNHFATSSGNQQQQAYPNVADLSQGFHTYGVLWNATNITWYLDGNIVSSLPTQAGENLPMYMILEFSTGSCGDGWADCPENGSSYSASNFSANAQVDWVHAWGLPSYGNPAVTPQSGFTGGNGSCAPGS